MTTTIQAPKAHTKPEAEEDATLKELRPELHVAEVGKSEFLTDGIGPWCELAEFAIVTADGHIRAFRIQHCPAPSVKPNRLFAHWDPCDADQCAVHWTDGGNHIIAQKPMFAGFAHQFQLDGKEIN